LYRNFIDPYAWHWKNGNTRWDILDVVRLCNIGSKGFILRSTVLFSLRLKA
jgi:exonuclease I